MAVTRLKVVVGALLATGVAATGLGVLAQQPGGLRHSAVAPEDGQKGAASRPIPRVDDVRASDRGMTGVAKARRRPFGEPKRPEPPAPKAIPVHVSGRALDTAGQPVAGATVTLMDAWMRSKVVATTTTDQAGVYTFEGPLVPVTDGAVNGQRSPDIAPFAMFQVVATAPGYGLTWHLPESVYALAEPNPDDIQGRYPFGTPVTMDLTFRPADSLRGEVVDEAGRPLAGVELSIHDADLLDADGRETSRNLHNGWDVLPGGLGRAETGPDGRFRIDGLPSEACFWLFVKRADFPSFGDALYAATVERPVAEHGQPRVHSGRGPHKVQSGDFTLVLPTPRRLRVRVVADDTGRPLAGVNVGSLGEALATGVHAHGTSDAGGRLVLELPPGRYGGVFGDPPIATRYLRTYRRDLTVAPEPAEQPYELRMQAGCELLIDATDGATGKGLREALFWLVPTDNAAARKQIQASTFGGAVPWTDENGRMRAVLPPEPGRTYRITFAGLRPPNHPAYLFGPEGEQPRLDVEPAQSAPFELAPGATVHLKFRITPEGG